MYNVLLFCSVTLVRVYVFKRGVLLLLVLLLLLCILNRVLPQDFEGPPKKMARRVKRFFAAKKDRLSDIVPRFVVVDGMER